MDFDKRPRTHPDPNIMRWQQTEFVLKGIFLGLLLFVGLTVGEQRSWLEWWKDTAQVGLCTLVGLALCLSVAAVRKLAQGYRIRGRFLVFLLFLVLENPVLVYSGVLLGTLAGACSLLTEYRLWTVVAPPDLEAGLQQLLYCVAGGAGLGVLFNYLRDVQAKRQRLWFALVMGASLVIGVVYVVPEVLHYRDDRLRFATLLLMGIPIFFLLTLAAKAEESEVEVAAICAALGVSFWFLCKEKFFKDNDNVLFMVMLVPPAIYYVYTRSLMPGLRVFKHYLRGVGYANARQIRPALIALGRALELDPQHDRAREQLWYVHRLMDFDKVAQDPQTLALINFDLCLGRVGTLLMASPQPEHLHEAYRLMNFIASQRPEMQPACDYWRAVALTHERNFDEAAAALERVIAGVGTTADNPHRHAVLYQAWLLAVRLHPELQKRVGNPQLSIVGRRMQAIAAVERHLETNPGDANAIDLKRVLYADLTESEYLTQVTEQHAPRHFDHAYVQQLGLEIVNDPGRWPRGCEYLRMAAVGLPQQGPTLFLQIAKAHERAGNFGEVWQNYELVKKAGQHVGIKELSSEDRQTYFAVLRALADDAAKRGAIDEAIENYKLFGEYDRAGIETQRTLADLYERKGEPWMALASTERGLLYDAKDQNMLERKDRYYYSVYPSELKTRWDQVRKWFDVAYCKQKAEWLLRNQGDNLELLDWATHLAELAQTAEPGSLSTRVLRAKLLRRRGEIDRYIALLEEVRNNKPAKFASNEEEEAWYVACRLLGHEYLNNKPDQAILCYQEYRKHGKSGADTVYRMGVAYENLGDLARAIKCYEVVAAYDSHPLAPDARMAIQRLKAGVSLPAAQRTTEFTE
jgi:hypothetical protein